MKRTILTLTMAVALLASCSDDDEIVEIKDYDLKSMEVDLDYDSEAAYGEVAYKQQTYIDLETESEVATGTYGDESWTDFYLVTDTSAYNASSDVSDWDLVCTYYTEALEDEGETIPYGVAGVLINTEANIEVAKMEYSDSDDDTDISEAFADLELTDVSSLTYSTAANAIGYDWKTFSFSDMLYTVNTNWFYIIKLSSGDTYKLRFTGFYGSSTDERVVKFEYQLMQ